MKRSRAKRANAVEEPAVAGGHRYTGPELSALLDQVRRELGAEASIVAADRIRQGGVAGFFATETFEVVASPSSSNGARSATEPQSESVSEPIAKPRSRRGTGPGAAGPGSTGSGNTGSGTTGPGSEQNVATALLERADAVSIQEREEAGQLAGTYDLRDQAAARSRVDGVGPSAFRFSDVLEATLHESVIDDDDALLPGFPGEMVPPVMAAPITEAAPSINDVPSIDDVTSEEPAVRLTTPQRPNQEVPRRESIEYGWSRLVAVDGVFAHRPVEAQIVALVGELEPAIEVANRLVRDESEPYTELVVFAPEHKRTPQQSSSILYHHADLRERLFQWAIHDLKGIVVIDAAFGEELRVEVQRARNHGCTLVRLAYTDDASACRLLGQLEYIGGHVVMDVVHKTDRRHVETLVQFGIPVVSIGGRSVDPGMLFALANGVGGG